jgi:myo-inositol-1(or 4)-monophosphatase
MKHKEISAFHKLAEIAAKEAGALLLSKRDNGFEISKKGWANLVTEADLLAEELIVKRIRAAHPDHQILAEERGVSPDTGPVKWVIDPLDGTTNYAHGYPLYCVSIGVEVAGKVVAGVVFDPVADECFSAIKGQGATLNGDPISVSEETDLEDSLLVTGFSYGREAVSQNLRLFNEMMMVSRSVRRDGSAALDLCYVACGRYDGFWELSLSPWDVAAGGLIVEEAGGVVSGYRGQATSIYDGECLATNGGIHKALSEILTTVRSAE